MDSARSVAHAGHEAPDATSVPLVAMLSSPSIASSVPLDGVTELRVHGVGGTTPEDLLEDPHPVAVAGDEISGFWRTEDRDGRHVEAYSWGGLTSRASSRVLWLLLLPFSLVNLAGWMRRPAGAGRHGKERMSFRATVRMLSLTMTLAFVAWPIHFAMDAVAYQCGGQPVCYSQRALEPLAASWLADYPGRRVAVAAFVPVAFILLLGLLARRSRRRYEEADPMARSLDGETLHDLEAARRLGLSDPNFWRGDQLVRRLGRLHLAAGIALIGLVLARATVGIGGETILSQAVSSLSLGLIVVVFIAACAPSRISESHSGGMLWGAVAALGLGLLAAVSAPAADTPPGTMLPGFVLVLMVLFVVQLALLLALGLIIALGARHRTAPPATDEAGDATVPRWGRITDDVTFQWAGPLVAATLGVVLLLAVTAAVNIRIMDTLGQPTPLGSQLFGETREISDELTEARRDADGAAPEEAPEVSAAREVGGESLAAAQDRALAAAATAAEQAAAGAVAWIVYPPSLDAFAIMFTVGMVVLAIAGVWQFASVRHRRIDAVRADVAAAYTSQGAPDSPDVVDLLEHARWREVFTRPIVRWRLLSETVNRVDAVLSVTVITVLAMSTGYVVWRWTTNAEAGSGLLTLPSGLQWVASLSSWVMALLPIVGLLVLRAAYRDPLWRRRVASIFDVVTFWPRAWHPLAPPAYPERAVPELARRIVRIHRAGGRALLSAHSQGTVLAAAAVAQLPEDVRSSVAVVTHGSPLGRLYRRFFPAYFGGGAQAELRAKLAENGAEPKWRNFFRLTDVIGGPVFDGPDTCDCTIGPDIELRDPQTQLLLLGDPPPRVLGHVGYGKDPTFAAHIDELARDLHAALARPQSPHVDAGAAPHSPDQDSAPIG